VHRLARRAVTDWVPAQFWAATGTLALHAAGRAPGLKPPWPRLLIAAGRPSVGPAIAIRRASQGATFVVQLQDPRVAPTHFDLVVPPAHDGLAGPNVLPTLGALHRITPIALASAATQWQGRYAALPHPRIAVLIGGASKHHRMSIDTANRIGTQLRALCTSSGASLMITTSRRTDPACQQALAQALIGLPVDFWDGTGDNPYTGMLATADGIVVTADSVTMASEAASTGKPVFIADLVGGSPKFDRFHEALRQRGISRRFDGHWATWTYQPLNETHRIAEEIRLRLALPPTASDDSH
ncbi:MAG: mitochondrial fission ELM1 family protein, partial [Alphaproteobacteria bacterium]|nr:mitochondrial fission ELM1 family protein [Alphaproteobacteria bacterium]